MQNKKKTFFSPTVRLNRVHDLYVIVKTNEIKYLLFLLFVVVDPYSAQIDPDYLRSHLII